MDCIAKYSDYTDSNQSFNVRCCLGAMILIDTKMYLVISGEHTIFHFNVT